MIGKPLADRATYRFCCSLGSIDAELGSIIVPQIKLGEIAVQASFAHTEITTIDAALQNREEVFDSVGMGIAANLFGHPVSYGFVTGKLSADFLITPRFVGAEMTFPISVLCNNRLHGCGSDIWDIERSEVALTFHQRHNGSFALRPAIATLAYVLAPFLAADIGFVRFKEGISPAKPPGAVVGHREADTVTLCHAVRRVTPSMRRSWLLLMPFLLPHIITMACSHRCIGTWLSSKMVPILTVKGLRQA